MKNAEIDVFANIVLDNVVNTFTCVTVNTNLAWNRNSPPFTALQRLHKTVFSLFGLLTYAIFETNGPESISGEH